MFQLSLNCFQEQMQQFRQSFKPSLASASAPWRRRASRQRRVRTGRLIGLSNMFRNAETKRRRCVNTTGCVGEIKLTLHYNHAVSSFKCAQAGLVSFRSNSERLSQSCCIIIHQLNLWSKQTRELRLHFSLQTCGRNR